MSLTLRDAQHLCWKTLRIISDKIDPERGKHWTPFATVNDLAKSTEKIALLTQTLEETGPQMGGEKTADLATSLSDLLYSAFVLAEHYGLSLEDEFLQTMNDRMISHIG
jgi:hypothetical protein